MRIPFDDQGIVACELAEFTQQYDGRMTVEATVQEFADGAVFRLRGMMQQTQPLFEPQPYIDAERGVTMDLRLPSCSRIVSVYQHKCWWTRPSFPDGLASIPERSQLVLLQYDDLYAALLAICGDVYRADIEGAQEENGTEVIRVRARSNQNDLRSIDAPVLVITWGGNPYDCIHRAGEAGARAIGNPQILREHKRYPEIMNGFGWCTWDAFYHEVSEQGILNKLEEFRERNIPVQWVLIDDGWSDADLEAQRLRSMDAAPDRFPHGLAETIRVIKEDYGIPYVGVWHAVMGYWNGLEPGSVAEREFAGTTVTLPDGRIVPAPDAERAFGFYSHWHQYLKAQCDVDFVKVDEQSAISILHAGRESYGAASGEIQKGLNASVALYYDNAIINCMGMAPEDVWHRPSSMITRTSDDFVPRVPHGFREHAIQNAYSTLWAGLFYTGDWDMFHSDHPENEQNAILRAISGGPVYTSDQVGRSDRHYILPLLYADGEIVRCEGTGRPTLDCLFQDPVQGGSILKIYNHRGDCYYIAAFNIREDEEEGTSEISVQDIPGLTDGDWLVYDRTAGTCTAIDSAHSCKVTLAANEARIYEIAPALDLTVLGNPDKFIAGGCVEVLECSRNRSVIRILESGSIVVASGTPVHASTLSTEPRNVTEQNGLWHIEGCGCGEILIVENESQ